jgi:hypothetical protein
MGSACRTGGANTAEGPSCEERQSALVDVLKKLPHETLAAPIAVTLPASTLRGGFGRGAILQVSDVSIILDGKSVAGNTRAEQLNELTRRLSALPTKAERPPSPQPRLYLAAARSLDVTTLHEILEAVPKTFELRLLFVLPPVPISGDPDEHELPARVLVERDMKTRHNLARQGYEEYSDCEFVGKAAASVEGLNDGERWPRLQQAMLSAVPKCECDDLDADGLRLLLAAEQRAGTVALGSVPMEFLRDQRCTASMPLRSMQQILDDIDEFDAEFAGDWQNEELHFEDVVTNERLLNSLCVAMPGDTLASLQRERATLFWRVPGAATCQAWQFEPLARGAPMGTWRRAEPNLPPLAMHYRQAAEELRLFGPTTDANSKATDDGPWPCDQDFHLVDQSDKSVSLEKGGSWFYERAACEQAESSKAVFPGCIANVAGGAPPPALPIAPPAASGEASMVPPATTSASSPGASVPKPNPSK